jgi:predicted HD superfamily hydrolase involved in NAD metabolism
MQKNYEEMKQRLSERLSIKRFQHSLGVSETAASLAQRFDGNAEKARIAGLLHDCAREIPVEKLLSQAKQYGIKVDDVEQYEPVLLHAPISAYLAKFQYGISDENILRAIRLHTTGGLDMTLLDKIIYVADVIEPNRHFLGVDALRELAERDLELTVLTALDQSVSYILKGRGVIHPATIEARNQFVMQKRK